MSEATRERILEAAHDLLAAQGRLGYVGANDVNAVEGGLGRDRGLSARVAKALLLDDKPIVLGHVIAVEQLPHP